jgi:hypothetical protein
MTITVAPASASFTVTTRPAVSIVIPTNNGQMWLSATPITIAGQCQIAGVPGDDPAGWTLGVIQLMWIDTFWAYYRGQRDADGSLLLQFSPAGWPNRGCRDTIAVPAVFNDDYPGFDRTVVTPGTALPKLMSAQLWDQPGRRLPLTRVNSLTRSSNFLREVQCELHFCTTLSLLSPAGAYQHLKHIYWNLHWQGRFQPTDFTNVQNSWSTTLIGGTDGNAVNISSAADGAPTDRRFTSILTAPGATNCNVRDRAAVGAVVPRESRKWENFDVTR